MQENNLTLYKNVFNRKDSKSVSFKEFITNPIKCLGLFDNTSILNWEKIKSEEDKSLRSELKRNHLPAALFIGSNILSLDIDDLFDKPDIKARCIERLTNTDNFYNIDGNETQVLAIQESVSGNLVIYFKYDCTEEDYSRVYYLIYLKITMLLGVNIDFLPDLGRLRYLSNGTLYYFNEEAHPLTEMFEGEVLPIIHSKETPKKARRIIYKSL